MINIVFAEAMIEYRNLSGMTQRKAALEAGVSPSYLNKIEKGEMLPGVDAAKRLAKLYNVNTDELLASMGRIDPELEEIIIQKPREIAALIHICKGLTQAQMQRAIGYAEAMKDGGVRG